MKDIYSVSEVKLSYEPKVKAKDRPQIRVSKDIYNLLIECVFDSKTIQYKEYFKIVLLNRASRVLGIHTISEGGINETNVDIRLILQAALLTHATAIILAHNHPSGELKPSNADNKITERIKQACKLMDIELLDHLIVTPDSYYSYLDEGRL